jgi:soluble lytic murein transglycosylase
LKVSYKFTNRMRHFPIQLLSFLWFSLLTGSIAIAAAQDDAFLAAKKAYAKGDAVTLEAQLATLDDYVLAPYVRYWQIRMEIEHVDAEEVRAFLDSVGNTLVGQRMRADWVRELAKREQWEEFLIESEQLSNWSTELTCYSLQARIALGDDIAIHDARDIWFNGRSQPESCIPLFEAMFEQNLLRVDAVWSRFRLSLESGNRRVAKAILKYLPENQRSGPASIYSISRRPQKYLQKSPLPLADRTQTEFTIYALYKAAGSWPDLAAQKLDSVENSLSEADRSYAWGQVALAAARDHHPQALDWFKRADQKDLNDGQLEWRARAALRREDWAEVAGSVESMSPDLRSASRWRYWKARALESTGQPFEANALLASLSNEFNFYGQLAAEQLGNTISSVPRTYQPDAHDIAGIAEDPGLQRALALYRNSMRYEGALEWAWTVKDYNDRQLLAAAALASQNEWYERSIHTAVQTRILHDFALRFPAPYRDVMREYTNELELDEAWVYGLVRQESRFVVTARSSAGAGGLMQIMPSTAKWIAERLRLTNYDKKHLNIVDTNISMGTYYLREIMDSLDNHPVVASAGYNAGPRRAARWRGDRPLAGEIYAETIPFSETRNYVKRVMSNTMYYARLFRQTPVSLRTRLGLVPMNTTSTN